MLELALGAGPPLGFAARLRAHALQLLPDRAQVAWLLGRVGLGASGERRDTEQRERRHSRKSSHP